MPTLLNDQNRKQIIKSDSNLMLYFTASWCGPCKRMKPEYNKAEEFMKDLVPGLIFTVTDVDESEGLCKDFLVQSMPTIIIIKKGKIVERSEGAINKEKILLMIGKYFDIKENKVVVQKETKPVVPKETKQVVPKETKQVVPKETKPVVPKETKPVVQKETKPVVTKETKATAPKDTNTN